MIAQYDISIFQSRAPRMPTTSVIPTMLQLPCERVTGKRKTAQRYVITLLSKRDDGSDNAMLSALLRGQIWSIGGMYHYFNIENFRAMATMSRDDEDKDRYGDIPEDDRLESATLTDVIPDYNSRTIAITVKLRFAAGDTMELNLPISTEEA